MEFAPRPYQLDALKALRRAVFTDGIRRNLVAHPTGTGKTILFTRWLKRLQKHHGLERALILAHRDELIEQAAEKYRLVTGDEPGIVKAARDEHGAQTVIASVQTLMHEKRLRAYLENGLPQAIVIDEAHHAAATSYLFILRAMGAFEPCGPLVLGVTATPKRSDDKALGKIFQQVVHHYPMLDGIRDGYLCPPRGLEVRIDADMTKLRSTHGDIRDDDSEALLLGANAPVHIANAIKEFAVGRPTLVFTPTVAVSERTQAACAVAGLTAAHLDGTTPLETRHKILQAFHRGQIQVLCNCGVLTEGYDEERIACVVMARPTKSQLLYVQCVGRGTRLHPDKEDCLIMDVVGVTHRHDLITHKVLATEEPVPIETEDDAARETFLRQLELDEDETPRKLTSRPVDLFATRPFAWLKTRYGYVLDLAGAQILLEEVADGWRVHHFDTEDGERTRAVVFSSPSLGYAQGYAEDLVRAWGKEALAKRAAPWRAEPMTWGQEGALKRWRVAYSKKWTKGDAADALTKVSVEAAARRAGLYAWDASVIEPGRGGKWDRYR